MRMRMTADFYGCPSDSGKRCDDVADKSGLPDVLRLAADDDERHNSA